MRITLTVQIGSAHLPLDKISEIVGYPGRLVPKGADRIPVNTIPKSNTWNGDLTVSDSVDINTALEKCFKQYPEIVARVRELKKISPDIETAVYICLCPFQQDFVLLMQQDIVKILGDLECKLSIEYFDDA